jgi:YgiT-type zinc finger domain-containing protein
MKKPRSNAHVHRKKEYDYGECHVCGEQMQEQRINQDFWLKGKLVVIESVPAAVCPQCGERIVKADVGRRRKNQKACSGKSKNLTKLYNVILGHRLSS